MSTAEINAYLEWRAEREGKMVDVSPEAYERHQIVERLLNMIRFDPPPPIDHIERELWPYLADLVKTYDALEEEN